MENGVYTSLDLEVAQTKHWAICFYCNHEKSVIGAELYNGVDDSKKLANEVLVNSLKSMSKIINIKNNATFITF